MKRYNPLALMVLTVLTGCSGTVPSAASVAKGPAAPRVTAYYNADIALHSLNAAEPEVRVFTPEFLQRTAPPETDDDRTLGYSQRRWSEYFWNFKGSLPGGAWRDTAAKRWTAETSCMIIDTGSENRPLLFIRTQGAGSDARLDWLQMSRRHSVESFTTDPARWTATAFLAALVQPDDASTIGLMSPSYKSSLAPVFSKADEARGYNPGTLAEKLKLFRGDATGFEIASVDGDIVKGHLISPAGKKSFTMKLATGPRAFERLVDAFTVD